MRIHILIWSYRTSAQQGSFFSRRLKLMWSAGEQHGGTGMVQQQHHCRTYPPRCAGTGNPTSSAT